MSNILVQFTQTLGDTDFSVDLTLPPTGITAIFGRSGAGKTSLINVIAGLSTPASGKVTISDKILFCSTDGINVPVHKRKIGYVFQESRLFPHMKVKSNLLYGATGKDDVHFSQITALLALDKLLDRYPIELSGGEKQRVAIGRALLTKPEVLLMDEPLASLDLPRKREVLPFLEELANTVNVPILYVTHSMNEILRLANHLVVVEKGEVVQSGPIEKVWSSHAMRPWQSFSDQSSLFEGKVLKHSERYGLSLIELTTDAALWVQRINNAPETKVRLQVKASDVSITLVEPEQTSIRNVLKCSIHSIEILSHTGNKQSVSIGLELGPNCYLAATITTWALEELSLKKGQRVYAQVKGVSVTQRDIALSH
ncbi:molybdenum ABC transporter ATP-binding protein ModC [Vibrio sp. TRT 17S01]|uniref:molybdenum ABC transporter ATP-binding protein ModC n=1 Tax=Vibrio sp. TRT 17S01 TaxID=3418505 RepID=UPI003CEABAF4